MSTPVTAAEVQEKTDVWHDNNLCHVTTVKECGNGSRFITWTEDFFGREMYLSGSFSPGAYFGDSTTI